MTTHNEFADQFYASHPEVVEGRVPVEGMVELTRLCSLKCTHCYIGDARWQRDPSELSTDELKRLLDALAERGTLWLTFTGGEALMRRDFRELWLYARSKGFLLILYTNATLITESMAEFLAQHPPLRLEVSIYGATEETYERVTLVKGSFKRFQRGLENIQRHKLPWMLKTAVIKENAHELEEMRALAAGLGVRFNVDSAINASLGKEQLGGKAPCASRVEADAFAEHELANPHRRRELEAVARALPREPAPAASEPLFNCGAGRNSFYVDSRGELQMCILTPHRGASLKAGESMARQFDQAWERFGEVREIKRRVDSPCHSCDLTGICQSCPGFAQLESGDEHAAVEWLCRSTHLKALKAGIPHRCDVKHFVYSSAKKP